MMLLFRILILALLFWVLQPSYEAIYYYHFGTVTNSDALYPYLFIKDFEFSNTFVTGWVTPPSHCLFPDLILIYILNKFTPDIFLIHFGFAFFCFLSIIYLLRAIGFSRSVGVAGALILLRIGEYYPSSWGQFFLPSFHGTEFFLLGLCLRIIRSKEKISFKRSLFLGIVIGISIYSELWFLVHSLIPICIFILASEHMKPPKMVLTAVSSVAFYFFLIQIQKKIGIGSFQPKQFPLGENLTKSFLSLRQNPGEFLENLVSQLQNIPLSELLLPTFAVLFLLTIFRYFRTRSLSKHLILPIAFLLSLFFIKINLLEPNARYFYFLPISCVSLFFFQIQSYPKLTKILTYLMLIGLIFVSHRFWLDDTLKRELTSEKSKHEERLNCTINTVALWGNIPGSSTYWPVKYLRAFSDGKIHLIPFTPDGVYYPWVHNLNWDKDITKKEIDTFGWGITSPTSDLIFGKKGIDTKICGDWKLIRISK